MTSEESVIGLFSHLCELQLQSRSRAYLIQPKHDKLYWRKKFHRKLYDTLFGYLKGPQRCKKIAQKKKGEISEVVDILSFVFNLRTRRKFDEAARLEQILGNLMPKELSDGVCDEDNEEIKNSIRFLVCLAGTAPPQEDTMLGHEEQKLPILQHKKSSTTVLPNGPLMYGDTQLCLPEHSSHYMHYPNDLFEKRSLTSGDIPVSIFDGTPGQGLSGCDLFGVKGYLNDLHEKCTSSSLFGALIQGRVMSLDVRLDIPELPEDMDSRFFEVGIPKSKSNHSQVSEDEGFIETDISTSTSTMSIFDDSAIGDDIWEKALDYKPSRHYTWETIGCEPGPTSKPYFSEAGPRVLDEWYNMLLKELILLCPSVCIPPRICISQRELVEDIINLLIGVPSYTFSIDLERQTFNLQPGVYESGTTPEAIEKFLQDFLVAGTNYYRLKMFSEVAIIDSFYKSGVIFQAFAEAVRRFLQHYRAMILSIEPKTSFLELSFLCQKVFAQMRYLTSLCHCEKSVSAEQPPDNGFPVGISLLTYLYEETLESCNTENYPLLLFILQTSLRPYTLFVQDWVFHGVYRDVYGEFMIQVNDTYLESRDRHFWSHGYIMKATDIGKSVPSFLSDMASDIFICGKSLNLLKICCSQHFICKINDLHIPKVMVTYSERALHQLADQCSAYIGRVKQMARQLTISRKQMEARTAKAKQDLMHNAKQIATESMNRLQSRLNELKKAEDTKKRKEFKFLKEQMETDLQRRADEKKTEKDEDKMFMDLAVRKEETIALEERELEQRAREEVIQYYEKLSEAAAFREQKALWKVRRAKLDIARIDFLSKEETKLGMEMKMFEEKQAEEVKDSLPKWVNQFGTGTVLVTGHEVTAELPSWAQKGLSQPPNPALGLDHVIETDLPQWARQGLQKYGDEDEPLIVSEEEPEETTSKNLSVTASEVSSQLTLAHVSPNNPERTNVQSQDTDNNTIIPENNVSKIEASSIVPIIASSAIDKDENHVSNQTVEKEECTHIKLSTKMHSTKESENIVEEKPHIKSVDDKHISQESEEAIHRTLVKINEERNVSKESEQPDEDFVRKRHGDSHISQETAPTEWKVKKQSFFGHVSQLSNLDYEIVVPVLKHSNSMSASKESEQIIMKPGIKMNEKMSSTKESEQTLGSYSVRPQIKMSQTRSSTKESESVDLDAITRKKFLQRNVHGHSSQSTVQKLLYGEQLQQKEKISTAQDTVTQTEVAIADEISPVWLDEITAESYMDNFDILNDPPVADLITGLSGTAYGSVSNMELRASEIDAFKYVSLPVLLQKSVTMPLVAQISLVNESVINYFTVDLQIDGYFKALRRYLLMEDGDFAQNISDFLMEKLSMKINPHQLLNPVFLNTTLTKALRSSMHADDKYADNLSFAIRYLPKVLNMMNHDTLDCLELRFKTDWPVNIVITEASIDKYGKVFSFMLQLKRIVWVLKDVWHRLKRDAVIHGAGHAPKFRQLHLYRQEMQHFVKVMQGYIANQIIHVTWQEFEEALKHDVQNLDDLYRVHMDYLNKAFFRCLLTKNATPVMKIIQEIFCRILKFHAQLISSQWSCDPTTGEFNHSNFSNMVSSYKAFKKFSVFLFKVVNKLAIRGYQPHLQELLLRLNFNDYYKES